MNDREKVACGRVSANSPTSDPVTDRAPQIAIVLLVVAVIVRFAVGGAVFERIWMGLNVVLFGAMIQMYALILGLLISFGEERVGTWLTSAHRRIQSIIAVCCLLISAACYYHFYDYIR